ncbi:MAG TPA: hypothetical protein VN688_21700 [Gemmataceae bacterium]|nr:hypothetical protein [Gemmataceae bacterium]
MYSRLICRAALLGLMLAMPALARAAEEPAAKSDKPSLILRFAALDQLRADLGYLAELVGQKETAKQIDGIFKSKIGEKGLEGIDTKQPIGAYGWVKSSFEDSPVVVLVPVADEKAFLGFLESLDVKTDKGADGLYTANHEKIPVPIYFRFANKYAYITALHKDILDKDKLLAPAKVLPAGQIGDLSITVNIDQIPDNIKELGLGGLDNQLAKTKEKLPQQGTESEQKFRAAMVDDFGAAVKSLLTNGGETTLRMDVDRKTTDVTLSLSVAGKPGTPLAMTIKNLGQTKSTTASLIGSNSAMRGALTFNLPPAMRAQLGPMIEEGEKKAIDKETDKSKRKALTALLKALRPTFKSGELDVAADLRGPNEKGLYSAVAGIKVKDGTTIDKTFRDIVAGLPAEERKAVQFDVEKVGAVGIHRVTPDKNDKNTKETFGDNPVYFAVREDALLVGMGDKGLSALKEAVAAEPKASKVMEFEMALSQFAPLMVKDNKSAPAVAKKVFADGKDNDKVRISIEGGKVLKLRLSIKGQAVTFFNELQQKKPRPPRDKAGE